VAWAEAYTFEPSGISIHPAVWLQQTWADVCQRTQTEKRVQVSDAAGSSADLVAVAGARLSTLVARTVTAVTLRTQARGVVSLRFTVHADERPVRLYHQRIAGSLSPSDNVNDFQ